MKKLIIFMLPFLSSCMFFKTNMKDKVKSIIKKEYNVEVEIVNVKPAIHLGWGYYQFSAHLKKDPLGVFGFIYVSSDNSISDIDMDYIQFRLKEINKIKQLFDNQDLIVEFYPFTGADTKYDNMELSDLNDLGTSNRLSVHIYRFTEEGEIIDLHYFQPIIDELKKLNNVKLSIVLTTYSDALLNKIDLFSNDFKFGFEYMKHSSGFEVRNMDKKLNHFMVYEVSSETLLSEWEKALIKEKVK